MGRAVGTARALAALLALAGCQRLQARRAAQEGARRYARGDYAGAAERFRRATELEPGLAAAHLNLGYAHLALVRPGERDAATRRHADAAIASLRRYRALRPDDPRAIDALVSVWTQAERTGEALAFFAQEHERRPRDEEVLRTLAALASRAGRTAEALDWAERRAALVPRDPVAHYAVGTLTWESLHGHPEVAGAARVARADRGLRALERALALRTGYPEALAYANLLYRERALGQTDDAARRADLAAADRLHRAALSSQKGSGQNP